MSKKTPQKTSDKPAATTSSAASSPKTGVTLQTYRQQGPNPHRITLSDDTPNPDRLINPERVKLSEAERRAGVSKRGDLCTINLVSLKVEDKASRDEGALPERVRHVEATTYNVGCCVRTNRNQYVFFRYPSQEGQLTAMRNALEHAVSRAPAMTDLLVVTQVREMRDPTNYSDTTRRYILDYGCRVKAMHPLANDLGNVLAQMAAHHKSGPEKADYHLYTASITDGKRAFTACVLWGNKRAWRFLQALNTSDLAQAEAKGTEWAFGLAEENSTLMVINASTELRDLWLNPSNSRVELRTSLRGAGMLMSKKHLRLKNEGYEDYHAELAHATRQMAASLYADSNPNPNNAEERSARRKARATTAKTPRSKGQKHELESA